MLIFIIIFISQLVISIAIIKFSYISDLVDIPDKRKLHFRKTAFTGGVILSLTYMVIVFITDFNNYFINLTISGSCLATICGFVDDKYNVNPGTKIILQILAIFFVIHHGLYLTDIGSYEFIGKIKLGSFDKIFTLLCVLLIINASNYSDGIDGLLALIGCVVLGSYVYILIDYDKIKAAQYISIVILPFLIHLIFNFNLIKNFKVFLGNSGSNLVGFIISFIAIYLYKIEEIHPAVIIWPLAYLVYEFISIKIMRIYLKKKIFSPSRDHLHYIIYSKNNNKLSISLIIISFLNIVLSFFGILIFKFFGPEVSILSFIIFFFIYLYFRTKLNIN